MAEQTTIENEELETAEAAETTETTDTAAEAAAETAEAPAEPMASTSSMTVVKFTRNQPSISRSKAFSMAVTSASSPL